MRDGRTEIYLCLSLAYFPHLSACAAFRRDKGRDESGAHSNRRHFERSTVATDCGVSAKPIEKFRVKRRGAPENNNASKRVFAERENDRRAAFVCCLTMIFSPYRFVTVQETTEGVIGRTKSGSGGFGYDPVFYPTGSSRSFAGLSPAEKTAVSHRGKAAAALRRLLSGML